MIDRRRDGSSIKVLHVIDCFESGGAEKTIEIALDECIRQGIVPAVLVLNPNNASVNLLIEKKVPFHLMPKGFGSLKCCLLPGHPGLSDAYNFIESFRPHLFHAHLPHSHVIAWYLGKRFSLPYVITNHVNTGVQSPHKGVKGSLHEKHLRQAYRSAAHVISVSRSSLDKVLCDLPELSNTSVIENAVPDNFWVTDVNHITRQYDVLFCGRLTYLKNPLFAIECVAETRLLMPNVRALFVGDGELREECMRRVLELGLEKEINFSGWLEHQSVLEKMHASAVLLMPSISEGIGLSLLEALATGMGAVLSDIGPFREFHDPSNGVHVCPTYDKRQFADAIFNVIASNRKYDRSFLQMRFSVSHHVEELLRVYNSV